MICKNIQCNKEYQSRSYQGYCSNDCFKTLEISKTEIELCKVCNKKTAYKSYDGCCSLCCLNNFKKVLFNKIERECSGCTKIAKLNRGLCLNCRKQAKRKRKKLKSPVIKKNDIDNFYRSEAWLRVRYEVLRNNKKMCMLCGSQEGRLHVDHIKPRSKHPLLALDINNLQLLCADCNLGKSNLYEDDWRNRFE